MKRRKGEAIMSGEAQAARAEQAEQAEQAEHAVQNERGAVTAEYAVMLPGAALILVVGLLAGAASVQQIRLEEAAGAGVRQLARGETESTVVQTAHRMAGEAAALTTGTTPGWVSVTVSAPPPGPLAWWDGWQQSATAHAPDQWVTVPGALP